MEIYVVNQGDTVYGIASRFDLPLETVIQDNQLQPPYTLVQGQALLMDTEGIRGAAPIYSGGYAYPFISPWVLEQTLPYLSYLYIFSYGFTEEGNLLPPLLDDEWMITKAKQYGTAPVLTLTPFGADGNFNNALISAVINNMEARDNLRNQIIEQINNRGFEGVDIDFEFILASDRDAFVDFVLYIREAVAAFGFPVSVALAPKISAEQKGLLYEGKDYRALGEAADYVLVMAYEWGYTYGPPMAVAPLDKVRQVVEYARTEIAPDKIHLGIPNYGYDWPLPFIRGETKAETIGNIQAVQRAVDYGVPIQFDFAAQSPFYRYTKGTIQHEVWFQDVRSMDASFNLIKEYGLRGAGYWNIMQLFRANWMLMENSFTIIK